MGVFNGHFSNYEMMIDTHRPSTTKSCLAEQLLFQSYDAQKCSGKADTTALAVHKAISPASPGRCCESPSETFEPQLGRAGKKEVRNWLILTDCLNELTQFSGYGEVKGLSRCVEGLIALFFAIAGSEDFISMSATLFLYLRDFTEESVIDSIIEYMRTSFTAQSGIEDDICGSDSWVGMLKNVRTDWKKVRDCDLFSYFSKMLGLLVSLELCKLSSTTFSVKGYEVWSPDLKVVHGNAVDVFDAALCTVTFFVEKISLCWGRQSLKPLFTADMSLLSLDEDYATLIGWWELVKNGNLNKVAGKSDHDFDVMLQSMTLKLKELAASLKGFDKKLVGDKLTNLLRIENEFTTLKLSSGVRRAPFCIELFGSSSQGKTMYGDQVIQALLTSAGLNTDKQYQASYNASDKYMSTWASDKLVLCIDDMANDKSKFVEKPPTRVLIDVCNNQPMTANMADLGSKGKVFIEPEICLITTNVKDLDARIYSNCPYSIQRRAHIVITVRAKNEFQYMEDGEPQGVNSDLVNEYNLAHPDAVFDDIWLLTLEKAVKPADLKASADYKPVTYKGRRMVDVSFVDALQYLINEFHGHRDRQFSIISKSKEREQITRCPTEGCRNIKGICPDHPFEKQFGHEVVSTIRTIGKDLKDYFDPEASSNRLEKACTTSILLAARYFAKKWDWMMLVPTPLLHNEKVVKCCMLMDYRKVRVRYALTSIGLWGGLACGAYQFRDARLQNKAIAWGSMLGFGVSSQAMMAKIVMKCYRRRLSKRNTISPTLKAMRDEHITKICGASAILGALYGMAQVYKAWKSTEPQGSLAPTTSTEVAERDKETSTWTQVVRSKLPVRAETATTSSPQLVDLVAKNLVYATVVTGDKRLKANAMFVTSNIVMLPHHYFETETIKVTFRKAQPTNSGCSFAAHLSKKQSYLVPGTDICLCYCSTGGSFRDLRKYMNAGQDAGEFEMMWRDYDGDMTKATGNSTCQHTGNGVATFEGIVYSSLSMNTFRGLCGAALISRVRPVILGFHLGGSTGTPRGCAGILTRAQCDTAIDAIRKFEGVVVSGSAENFEPQVFGHKLITLGALHKKSPLNYMPQNSQIAYHGSCAGMTTFKSHVKVTPISHEVSMVMDSPNVYRGPTEHPQWKGWQDCLANVARPASQFNPDLLEKAIVDYKSTLVPIYSSELWISTKPLEDRENILGIPGHRFVDAIPMNTAIGFPLSGAKRNYVREFFDDKGNLMEREFNEDIMSEIKRCEDCYAKGERAYTIAKACKKDEVLAKDKVRIFYSNPMSLTFNIRKYFLPLVRVLQFNPLEAECAVGINSHGPEWQALHEHVFHFGDSRLIGGDYGKYDQKLPSQLLFAALRILIDLARCCNYTDRDLAIMEAMTGDIVYSLVAYNGDLIGLTQGTHISGNSLTVILNGICGSLNLRCYYYDYGEARLCNSFRDNVKLVTYGDDNIGSVKSTCVEFTIKGASEFLGMYGQTYTMPDKNSELIDFLPSSNFEFLKRFSVWHDSLQMNVGALSDASCLKMLHCFIRDKRSPNSEELACAINIDTALREWFNHGEEVYEKRRSQLKIVATKCNIAHLCKRLDTSYADEVLQWKQIYIHKADTKDSVVSDDFEAQAQVVEKECPILMGAPVSNLTEAKLPCSIGYHVDVNSPNRHVGLQQGSRPNGVQMSAPSVLMDNGPPENDSITAGHKQRVGSLFCISRKPTHDAGDIRWMPNQQEEESHVRQNSMAVSSTTTEDTLADVYTMSEILLRLGVDPTFEPQSGYEGSISKVSDGKTQNVKFSDQHDAYKLEIESTIDPTRKGQDNNDATLQNFFSRPLKISEHQWGTNTLFNTQLNPWAAYFENPRVLNRIANFKLLRAKLHIKVVINGNGFLYGRAAACYLPHAQWDTLSTTQSNTEESFVQQSQWPKIFLNPTTSTGGEMVLPFYYYYNYIDIPAQSWSSMGELVIRSINILKHASGAVDNVSVSVFAWAEDVEMSVLTSVEPGLVAQSGPESEVDVGNKQGIVSGPATKVAHAAGMVRSAPLIGPFASATAEVAQSIGNLAKVFGYSRPARTVDAKPYKPHMISSLSTTTTPDGLEKLSVDDKQELSIDPRLAGLGGADPMDIRGIASRESFLTSFTWPVGTAAETHLWNARVDPVIWNEGSTLPTPYHFPACAMAALPFEYWTGTMHFRFQIVASAFHKGRLKFVYDPDYLATNEYNVNYLEIVDIADKTDFTISVANGQTRTYLSHHLPGSDNLNQMYSTTLFNSKEEGNGVLGVFVVNELTVPDSTIDNDIQVNVYVSMGDDFEVAQPDDYFQRLVFKPQSGFEAQSGSDTIVPDSENTIELDRPEQDEANFIGPRMDSLWRINDVFFGETIRSFRPLLKRYCLHESIGPGDTSYTVMNNRRSIFPYLRGNVAGAVHLANAGTNPYNFCNTLLLHWLVNAHSGWRGSIRYKIIPRGPMDIDTTVEVERYNLTPGEDQYVSDTYGIDFYTGASDAARGAVIGNKNSAPYVRQSLTGYNGMARVHRSVNPMLEYEVPFYGTYRYSPGKKQDWTGPEWNVAPSQAHTIRHFIQGTTTSLVEIYVAAGEDIQTYFWTGLPPMYYESVPPPI